jgi:hypothetical protein
MSKQSKLMRNMPEEEAAIMRGIEQDPDAYIPTDEAFARMKRRGIRDGSNGAAPGDLGPFGQQKVSR